MKQKANQLKINNQINASEVRVIDSNKEMIGVMSLSKAILMAKDQGLDLVEISSTSSPIVCKIADIGKMKYQFQKKVSNSKKKQKVVETKEVKLSLNIGENDYQTKVKQVIKFIEKGNKVKVSLRVRGREITHLNLVEDIFNRIILEVENYGKTEVYPKMEGKQMIAVFASTN